MSSTEESPAQRAARQRRERREAKIKGDGAARLDKITSLSGRTPASLREETSPSPSPSASTSASTANPTSTSPFASAPESPSPSPSPSPTPQSQTTTTSTPRKTSISIVEPPKPPTILSTDSEYERQQRLIRQIQAAGFSPENMDPGPGPYPEDGNFQAQFQPQPPFQFPGQAQGQDEDPTLKLLQSLLSSAGADLPAGFNLDPNNPTQFPGSGSGSGPDAGAGFNPTASLLSSLGVPPFLASLITSATSAPSESEKKHTVLWKNIHVLFSVIIGVYLLVLMGAAVSTYGAQPPPPATARNPFVLFVTGEAVLSAMRILGLGGSGGVRGWMQVGKDVVRDGSLVVFLFGVASWWSREWIV
ncbi:hypothetical protein BO70DRAFT_378222 [Aspergillus heteromorphus CBS 117.55]|uniref:GET complex, subunit GET2 n=1 Tax=Aspergillus heteromorphus CBS 117.55 TaxID=1448321 RepID=A0A317WMD2_9EURO|nr:uncharacterized protein BO70DRAFT_378222 [Aspergillus heteromorphus CBS 117.55]PWY87624.1 hypothetical protein BO70DRAFT_378222 [Aspergillus heteromorphus CBS 117.55]